MRVLLVGDLASPHTRRWATGLAGSGATVAAAGFGDDAITGVETVVLGSSALTVRRYPLAVPRLRRVIRRWRPDVIHAHFVSSYGVMAALAAGAVPVVQTAWGSDVLWLDRRRSWHRRLVERTLRRARACTYDSDDVGHALLACAPEVPRFKVVFGPERSWTEASRTDERIVLSPRRLEAFYNVATIVDAFAAARLPGWSLEVLTYGQDDRALRERVSQLGLAGSVAFTGPLRRDQVRDRFLRAALFCSIPSSDATSAALLEGMAAGSVPVVSDLPANREWVIDGENGIVLRSTSTLELAAALRRAGNDAVFRAQAADRCRALVRETATWEAAITTMIGILERTLTRASRTRG